MTRPLPDAEREDFAPFWAATARHELVVQHCPSCEKYQWPPRALCTRCHELDIGWAPVATEGFLYSWTVVVHQTIPAIPAPYVVGFIELAVGVRFIGNVLADPNTLHVGLGVSAVFDEIEPGVTLVNWIPNNE